MRSNGQAPKPTSKPGLTAIARFAADARWPVACLVVLCWLCLLTSCVSVPTPTKPAPTSAAPTRTHTLLVPTPTIPRATPTPQPANWKDAFEVDYFPWAGSPLLHTYDGQGKVRVYNSIFFADPPFFGFDIDPPEGWHHVVGSEEYATLNGQLISPTIDRQWQPRDGDRVLLHGHVRGQSVVVSYVGVSGNAPYYYRSLLSAAELQRGTLPRAYDGLFVWVRGELDVSAGAGRFYELPAGTSFDPDYIGREAVMAGRLVLGDSTLLHVTGEIFVTENGSYVSIFDGQAWASQWTASHRGTIIELDPLSGTLVLERGDGRLIEVSLIEDTHIRFADGSPAALQALSLRQVIEIAGQASADTAISAETVTIRSVAPVGQPHAVYIPADGAGLWAIGLDDRRPHFLLSKPELHLGCSLEDAQLSPDGRAVVVECGAGEGSYLLTADLQTGDWQERLTETGWSETQPAWSPDGQRIVFCRHEVRDGQIVDAGLWVLNLADGRVRQIANVAPAGLQTVAPEWSPDGRRVAYGQASTTAQQPAILYVLAFPGQEQQITDEARDWRWSPDGTQLLVTRLTSEQGRSRLWIVQRDGTSLTWLSITGVHDEQGHWSPDGSQIAFLSRPWPGSDLDRLCIMQANGMRRIQPQGQPFANSVAWAGDGQNILFIRLNEDGQPSGLWMAKPDGSGLSQLAEDAVTLIGSYQAE
jgi:hypothetical protein